MAAPGSMAAVAPIMEAYMAMAATMVVAATTAAVITVDGVILTMAGAGD